MKHESECYKCKPIKEGGNRYPGCQCHCPHGIALKKKIQEERDMLYKARLEESRIRSVKVESILGINRRSGRWKNSK